MTTRMPSMDLPRGGKLITPDKVGFYGRGILTARHIKTGKEIVIVKNNLIVTVGLQLVGDLLIDKSGYDTGLTYQAIGTSATSPAVGDTTLTAEAARKAITTRTRSGADCTFTTFFTAAESTYAIEEAGVFGHSTATASADSGVLFSHWLVSFNNSGGTYDLTFDYVLTIG